MGESNSVHEFSAKLAAAGAAIGAANTQGVRAGSQVAKTTLLAAAAADTGGDLRLSRWGKRGLRLNVGYDIRQQGRDRAMGVVRPRPAGPWSVLSYGSEAHPIIPGASRNLRRAAGPLAVDMLGPVLPFQTAVDIHRSRRRRSRGRNARRRRVLHFGGKQFAAWAPHPGSKGKNTWPRGVETARPGIAAAYQKAQRDALLGAFR